MVLFIDAVSRGILCTNITYWEKDYESAFEELTSLVAEGWILQRALLVDGNSRVELPVAVFDGQSFREPIRQLQEQWQQLLFERPKPLPSLTHDQIIDWHYQLITYYEQQLSLLQTMILCLEKIIIRASKKQDSQLRLQVNDQYKSLLASQRRLLAQTSNHHRRAVERLKQLEN